MARKQRDYKAEYAASKRRAIQSGYRSEREYKRVRKTLNLPRNAAPIPRRIIETIDPSVTASASSISRIRREASEWSKKHSYVSSSKYRKSMTDAQAMRYHRAFVEPIPKRGSRRDRAIEKRKRIRDYMVPDLMSDAEWEGKYPIK